MSIIVTFWGVRGSIPSPLTPKQVQEKVLEAIRLTKEGLPLSFEQMSTYGGNTTCVEVQAKDQLFILDMGTGVRELGKAQMPELLRTKKLKGTILQSHVHWDHIQGLPFWAPMYMPRELYDCRFECYGGKQWDSQLDLVYRGQMNPPVFPVSLEELEAAYMNLKYTPIYDRWKNTFTNPADLTDPGVKVSARKLFHPQDTFGYRIEADGASIAFTTDHEPYYAGLPTGLAELVQGVDIWITDTQYTHDDYVGKNGPQKMGWGHSPPEYIATVARECKPKKIVTTHHDPDSSEFKILFIAQQVQELSGIETVPAYEGLTLTV